MGRKNQLTDGQQRFIKSLYEGGSYSWEDLAKKFYVSKRTIGSIVNPKVAERKRNYNREYYRGKTQNFSIKG